MCATAGLALVRERKTASAMGDRPGGEESVRGVRGQRGWEGWHGGLWPSQMLPRQTKSTDMGSVGLGASEDDMVGGVLEVFLSDKERGGGSFTTIEGGEEIEAMISFNGLPCTYRARNKIRNRNRNRNRNSTMRRWKYSSPELGSWDALLKRLSSR